MGIVKEPVATTLPTAEPETNLRGIALYYSCIDIDLCADVKLFPHDGRICYCGEHTCN